MVAGNKDLVLLLYPSHKKRPYIYVGVVFGVLLGIMLPHNTMGDNGQVRQRDSFTSRLKSKYIPTHKAKRIETRADAEVYLHHYGYLNCSADSVRQKRQLMIPEALTEGGDGVKLDECEDSHYIKALKTFQLKRNLTITGILDTPTKEKMMEGRCGNPDRVVPINEEEGEENSIQTSEPKKNQGSPWQNSNGPIKRSKRDTAAVSYEKSSHSILSDLLSTFKSMFSAQSGVDHDEEEEDIGDLEIIEMEVSHDRDFPVSVHWHVVPEGKLETAEHDSLLNLILKPHRRRKHSHRRQMLNDIKQNININIRKQRDVSNKRTLKEKHVIDPLSPVLSRRKRDQRIDSLANETDESVNHKWTGAKELSYRVLPNGFSSKIPLIDQCSTVALAFRMWAEVTNLDFRPARPGDDISDTDIFVGFGVVKHYDCDKDFDGQGGEIAHSNTVNGHSSFHIDDEEEFKAYPKDKDDGIPLLLTIIHEIGHVLGLDHLFSSKSVMYPTLVQEIYSSDFELTPSDRNAIQNIYGKCTGEFTAMFDWLHTNPNAEGGLNCMLPCVCENQYWQYYSYIFREDKYWLYLNGEKRPRYGDPLSIKLKWRNLPNEIDAVVQTTKELKNVCGMKTQFELKTIFFSGEKYYIYDDIEDKVSSENFISQRYGPLPGQSTSIPSDLDAVLFDPRDNYLYFFKNDWVGVVDPFIENPDNGSCCVKQYNFTDYFIFNASESQVNNTEVPELNGYIDTVYLRYSHRKIYFFKNNFVYMADITPNGRKRGKVWAKPGPVKLEFIGKSNDFWHDLCDVQTNILDYCSVSNLFVT